jgi:hypothetical protein
MVGCDMFGGGNRAYEPENLNPSAKRISHECDNYLMVTFGGFRAQPHGWL